MQQGIDNFGSSGKIDDLKLKYDKTTRSQGTDQNADSDLRVELLLDKLSGICSKVKKEIVVHLCEVCSIESTLICTECRGVY